jgi:hypothetical protein
MGWIDARRGSFVPEGDYAEEAERRPDVFEQADRILRGEPPRPNNDIFSQMDRILKGLPPKEPTDILSQAEKKIQESLARHHDSDSPFYAGTSPPVAATAEQGARGMANGRPSSKAFWVVYPNYDDIPPARNVEVWKKIGGSLGKSFGSPPQNSCAARVSYGLNYGGAPILWNADGTFCNFSKQSFGGRKGDNKYYIVSVKKLNAYLRKAWGAPDYPQVGTVPDLEAIIKGLGDAQCAVFATNRPEGHSGVLKKGYNDPYVKVERPVDVWKLPVP